MGVRNVYISVDSKLVANQVLGTYVAKEENMVKYIEKAKSLIIGFANFSIRHVPRIKNKKADALSKIVSTNFAHLSKHVLVEVLKEKSIKEEEVAIVVNKEGPTWMTLIMEYLKDGTLPGAGLILTSPEGTKFTYKLRFQFTAFNNEAEYEALIAGLRIAVQMGVRNVYISVDSKLVANQVLGTYIAKEENMVKYIEKAKSLIIGFANFSIRHAPELNYPNGKASPGASLRSQKVAQILPGTSHRGHH
nr:reverse transcriptase domain-containing protein [Tanacetum cinerariifolium]